VTPEDDCPILAMIPADEAVPADLFVEVVEALSAAHAELEQLSVTEIPWTDEELEEFKLAHDLQATMENAPEEWKPRLREIYVEVVNRSMFREPNGPKPTLLPGTLESFEELFEALRRAALVHPGVDAALRRASTGLA
jgi:hypothetical protein